MKTGALDVFAPLKHHDVSGPKKYESGDLLYPVKEEVEAEANHASAVLALENHLHGFEEPVT